MIRPATPDDAPALAALHARAFPQPWEAAALVQMMTGSGAVALLAPERGFILLRALAGEAEVLTLAVEPVARRAGVGRALVEAGAEAARASGAEGLFLEVAADNEPAIGLYRSTGFVPVGRRAGYYRREGGTMDALVLRRAL